MLKSHHTPDVIEAGVDEAGRGALCGPVVAAAVILPEGYTHDQLNDSKKLNPTLRCELRKQIIQDSLAWSIGISCVQEIDRMNILHASLAAMAEAVDGLQLTPQHLIIDGNKYTDRSIPYDCIIKGDGKYLSIAAASILAKTYRDDIMQMLHQEYPAYAWDRNKGYGTLAHRKAIIENGATAWHRQSFNLDFQTTLFR